MKDPCLSVSKLLEKYFDHEVTEQERSSIERHLLGCPTCQGTLKSMGEIRSAIKNPLEKAVEEEDFQRVWQNIQRDIRLKERPSWWESVWTWLDISPLFRRRVWIPAVAAAIILILIAAPPFFNKTSSYPGSSVVEYVESQDYNVMVYQSDQGKSTVIWLLDGPEEGALTTS